jgi:hypothetical protein
VSGKPMAGLLTILLKSIDDTDIRQKSIADIEIEKYHVY